MRLSAILAATLLATACHIHAEEAPPVQKSIAEVLEETGKADPELRKILEANLAKSKARFEEELKHYSKTEQNAFEELFKTVGNGGEEGKKALLTLINRFPKVNRTGCAVIQYAAKCTKSYERVSYWNMAQRDYSDCYFRNGTSVGALSRYLLAKDALKSL